MPGERTATSSPSSWFALVRRLPGRLRSFFTERIWDVSLTDLGAGRGLLYRVSRICYSTVRGIDENRLTFRAAALTYFSVLSIVPFLAFAFAVLKGFGAYRTFVDGTVRPYVAGTFSGNPALLTAIEKILGFVEGTDVSRLGTVGVLFLVYTSVNLVSSVEVTLNDIWGAKAQRPLLRQLTDYVTMLVIGPLLILVAATFATAAQSSDALLFLRDTLALGPVIDFLLRFTSVVIVGIALFATYLILPNTRTGPWSALVGAAVAAILWQIALILHVQFQMGVANYNALYSVLGAVPIFLVWTYVSWIIVLVGAQLAAGHQNERTVRQRLQARRADQALKELLAVAIGARVARDFLAGAPRRTHSELAELLEVPPPTVEEILDALVRAGLFAKAVTGREIGYLPGRDLDSIRVADLRDALRRDPAADSIRAAVARQLGPGVRRVVEAAEAEVCASASNLTLRELAEMPDRGDATAGAADDDRDPPDGDGSAVLDAKQPDIPA